jgi:AcrR family transcriptional regulator
MNIYSPNPPKQNRSVETVDIILSAVRLQLREGETLSMQSIADKAGVSIGTVYHHFKSRGQILGYAYSQYLSGIVDKLEDLLSTGVPAGEAVRGIFEQNIVDIEFYGNIREFLSENDDVVRPVWHAFAERVVKIILTRAPELSAGMDDACAEQIMRMKLESVRAMWQSHNRSLENVSKAYKAAFIDMLSGSISHTHD